MVTQAAQEHCTDHGPNIPRISHHLEELEPWGALTCQGGASRGRDRPSHTLTFTIFSIFSSQGQPFLRVGEGGSMG